MEYRNLLRIIGKKGLRAKLYFMVALVATTILSSTSDAVMAVYRNIVSENVVPVINSVWFKIYGTFNPIPEHHDYHFLVTFFIPPSAGNVGRSESTGVSIPGEECRKSGGATFSAPSSLNFENWQNNIITEANCSSGRVTVTLIPQTGGEKEVIYDGLFYEGKQITFSGDSGRYNAGVLKLMSTDRSESEGDWIQVNEYQKKGTCDSQCFD